MILELAFFAGLAGLGDSSRTQSTRKTNSSSSSSPKASTPPPPKSIDYGAIEYKKWLEWFVRNGGQVTHSYNYPSSRNLINLATNNSKFLGGYGSQALFLVIPSHVNIANVKLDNRTFHDNVYCYDMELMKQTRWIPQYEDCVVDGGHYQQSLNESMQFEREMQQRRKDRHEKDILLKDYDNKTR